MTTTTTTKSLASPVRKSDFMYGNRLLFFFPSELKGKDPFYALFRVKIYYLTIIYSSDWLVSTSEKCKGYQVLSLAEREH